MPSTVYLWTSTPETVLSTSENLINIFKKEACYTSIYIEVICSLLEKICYFLYFSAKVNAFTKWEFIF